MESSITKRAREFMESSRKRKKKKKKRKREENERAGELLESSGSKGEKKMRELLESGSKEKEKGEDVLMVYVCGGQNAREKKKKEKKEKGNVWMKERQRIRNHNLNILPQYCGCNTFC